VEAPQGLRVVCLSDSERLHRTLAGVAKTDPMIAVTDLRGVSLLRRRIRDADVIVFDVDHPKFDAPAFIGRVAEADPAVRLIGAYSSRPQNSATRTSLSCGASAVIPADSSVSLLHAILVCVAGNLTVTPRRRRAVDLSEREEEVFELLERGLSTLEIASAMGLKKSGVKFHIGNIFRKLGVHSRSDAVWPRDGRAVPPSASFTRRQQQVFDLLVAGTPTTEIAAALDLSPSAVKSHLSNIYRKMGVHTRHEALMAVRSRDSAHASGGA
jgi:DNA-binding NarL/FixJ family response regulator